MVEPTNFYVIIGSLIIANLSTIIAVFYGIGKVIWFLAKLESRVGVLETRNKEEFDYINENIKEFKRKLMEV